MFGNDNRDKYYKQEGRYDRLAAISKTALTVGVGAYFFRKHGGVKALSNETKRLNAAFKEGVKDVNKKSYRQLHGRGKELFKQGSENAIKAYREYEPQKIKINKSMSKGLTATLETGLNFKLSPNAHSTAEFNQKLKAQVMKTFREHEQLKGINSRQLDNIADAAFTHVSETFSHSRRDGTYVLSNKFKGKFFSDDINAEQQAIIEDILVRRMSNKHKEVIEYAQKNKGFVQSIGEKLLDTKEIASSQKSNGFFNKLIQTTEKISESAKQSDNKTIEAVSDIAGDVLRKIKSKWDQGESAATIEQILKQKDKFENIRIGPKNNQVDLMTYLEERVAQDEDFGKLVLDNAIRIDKKGDIYSVDEIRNATDRAFEWFTHTSPGKLIKPLHYISQAKKFDAFHMFSEGSIEYIGASFLEGGNKANLLNNTYYKIHNKIYKRSEEGALEAFRDANDIYMVSGQFEMTVRMLKFLSGDVDTVKKSDKFLFNTLGLGNTTKLNAYEKNIGKQFRQYNEDWIGNIIEALPSKIQSTFIALSDTSDINTRDQLIADLFEDVKKVNQHLSKNTQKASKSTINKLKGVLNEDSTFYNILDEYLALDNASLIERISSDPFLSMSPERFRNADLGELLQSYRRNPVKAMEKITIGSKNNYGENFTHAENFYDSLRKEIFKEGILSYQEEYGLDAIKMLSDKLGKSPEAAKEFDKLAYWSILQRTTDTYTHQISVKTADVLQSNFNGLTALFLGGVYEDGSMAPGGQMLQKFQKGIVEMIQEDAKDDVPMFTDAMIHKLAQIEGLEDLNIPDFLRLSNVDKAHRPEGRIMMRKAATPLTILQKLNDTTAVKAETKRMFTQFWAGRDNMEDVTTATLYPYFMLFRLQDALSTVDSTLPLPFSLPKLNLSPEDTGSVVDLAKNLTLKWALPAIGTAKALDYLNYETENITGTSLTGHLANGVANLSLAARSGLDAIGLGGYFKSAWYSNPALQYVLEDPYRDAQEQKEWYEDGYSAVRKSRWWAFGSASEFRGGKIEYFAPNYVKRMNTNWRDIGIYGSSDNKWSHSWIPTLRYPLAPINRLFNPYYLEKENKYSRPYPLTGKMFGEGTPFSGILNATIGNALKPQIQLHKDVLTDDYIDVRSLIKMQNEKTKQKAMDKNSTIIFKTSSSADIYYNGTYTPPALDSGATGGTKTDHFFTSSVGATSPTAFTVQEDTDLLGQSIYQTASTYTPYRQSYQSLSGHRSMLSYFNQLIGKEDEINILEEGVIEASSLINTQKAKAIIASQNQIVKERADKTRYAKQVDALSARDSVDLLREKTVQHDIEVMMGSAQYLTDIGYATKQLSGIYGFMFDEILPPQKRYALDSADQMNSFSRAFWDESVGGQGGDFMEIARRFFPHTNRSIIRVNPIMNNMPDWMPERFKTGDPYTLVKKGEMRLPGKAYQALHNIEPNYDFSIHPFMIGASEEELYGYFLNKSETDRYLNTIKESEINTSQYTLQSTMKRAEKVKKRILKEVEKGIINPGNFYSDFDRFRILADVAPWSEEYQTYKEIVRETDDPKQQRLFNQTLERVEKQSKTRQFFNYQYVGQKWNRENVVIDSIQGTSFKVVGDSKTYRMAGITANDPEVIQNYLNAGDNVRIEYNKADEEKDVIDVVVVKDASNINRELFKSKLVEANYDNTPTATRALSTANLRTIGAISEVIGHANLPFIHSKFLKMETAREAYENDIIYGATYSSWSQPIQTIVKPAIRRSVNQGFGEAALAVGTFIFSEIAHNYSKKNSMKRFAGVLENLTSPGVFLGNIATVSAFGFESFTKPKYKRLGSRIGFTAWAVGYTLNNAQNPIFATAASAAIGSYVGDFLEGATHVLLKDRAKNIGRYGKIGAAVGLGVSAIKSNYFKDMNKQIPKDQEKVWELEEYFDRIKYMKYKALYEKAARLAKKKEGVDIKRIFTKLEKQEEKLSKQKEEAEIYKQKILNSPLANTSEGQEMIKKLDAILMKSIEEEVSAGGEYTKSALAYKQAMDSTIYGLKKGASWGQIIRALPKNDREFFMEFAKVEDKKERKRILKLVSPYKQKVLKELWEEEWDKPISNFEYFRDHKLPNLFWRGWKPDIDLKGYEIKTIENEGLQLSDFGYYESEKDDPVIRRATSIDYHKDQNLLSLSANITSSLSGLGLNSVDVSIVPSDKPGINIVSDFVEVSKYNIKKSISDKLGFAYY